MTVEERFAKIVYDMASDLETTEIKNAKLKKKIAITNFPDETAGNCGKCGEYKHLPWRDESSKRYGNVCATCLRDITLEEAPSLDEQESEIVEDLRNQLQTLVDLIMGTPYTMMAEVMEGWKAELCEVQLDGNVQPKEQD